MCLKKHLELHTLLPVIDGMVDNVSRRSHRASLLLNHYAISCLESGEYPVIDVGDQMLYYTALNIDGQGNKYPELRRFYQEHRALYEDIPRVKGIGCPLNSAARAMKTVFSNYLWMTFNQRIITLFRCADRVEKRRFPLDRKALKSLVWRTRNMQQYVSSLAFQERHIEVADEVSRAASVLGDEEITDDWIAKNTLSVMRFLYSIMTATTRRGGKLFTILPVYGIKRHHIVIDGSALRDIMVSAGEIASSVTKKDFLSLRDDYFRAVFRVRKSWQLGNEVKTDGVSLCVNVWRTAPDPEDKDTKDQRLRAIYGNRNDFFACDPGEVNLAAVVHSVSGERVSQTRLTAKQLATESHATKNLQRRKRYDASIADIEVDMASETVKTVEAAGIESYLSKKMQYYPRLWSHHAARKTSAWRMDTYIHRWSCVDRFWHKVSGGGQDKPLMKYGSASVSSHGIKKRRAGPSILMRHSCRKHFVVVDVDEYMTTKRCCDCHEVTVSVGHRFIGPLQRDGSRWWIADRGLRRCQSNECRGSPLKSRDYAAAWNLGDCWPERPAAFCRSN